MLDECLNDGIQLKSEIIVKCGKCGVENIIGADEVYREDYCSEGNMGSRIDYLFSAECRCLNCLNQIRYYQ